MGQIAPPIRSMPTLMLRGPDRRAARPGIGQAERALLLDIAGCQVVSACTQGDAGNPCAGVVGWQGNNDGPRWTPEPWSGRLGEAPILFLSSNPSGAGPGEVPGSNDVTTASSPDRLVGVFDGAFDDGGLPHIENGIRSWDADGNRSRSWVRYWASAKARAAELLGHPPIPGVDYVLTEVVHCPSRNETAVESARDQCVARYLMRILAISPARVVVVYGHHAALALGSTLPAMPRYGLFGPTLIAGSNRWLLKLPHPNKRGELKSAAAHINQEQLGALRTELAR